MKIKKEVTKVVYETHKFCDLCDDEIPLGLACHAATCVYCGRDLCPNCIAHEDDTYGDYRLSYCLACWAMGKEYRPKINSLRDEADELHNEWRNECKVAAEKDKEQKRQRDEKMLGGDTDHETSE